MYRKYCQLETRLLHVTYFQSLMNLSWLAEATKPFTVDTAKAVIKPSWADKVIVLFSAMFHSSIDYMKNVPIINHVFLSCILEVGEMTNNANIKEKIKTCLITADDEQWRICWMENTWVKLTAITAKLMNTFPFISCSKSPNPNWVLTHWCQQLPGWIPTYRIYCLCMTLKPY